MLKLLSVISFYSGPVCNILMLLGALYALATCAFAAIKCRKKELTWQSLKPFYIVMLLYFGVQALEYVYSSLDSFLKFVAYLVV